MSWELLTIVDASHDDDALYPVLSSPDSPYPVEISASDGQVSHFRPKKVRILESAKKGGLTSVVKLPTDIKWDVLVTDSRVIVYCVKYDKGGGWWGIGEGAIFALAANAVSKARAAHRRKGKVLVGQVRFNWIKSVGASPKERWKDDETVRILVDAKPGGEGHRYLYIDLYLPKTMPASSVGKDIAARTARYRLAHDPEMTGEERSNFEALATSPVRPPAKSKPNQPAWAWYRMPTSYRVNATTAKPMLKQQQAIRAPVTTALAPAPSAFELSPSALPQPSPVPHVSVQQQPVGRLSNDEVGVPGGQPNGSSDGGVQQKVIVLRCEGCGREASPAARFCGGCGTPLHSAEHGVPQR